MIDTKKEQERDELHRAIWAIADELRGAVDGWDFKNYVLGTMFYRYISENLANYISEGEIKAGNDGFDYAKMSDAELGSTSPNHCLQTEQYADSLQVAGQLSLCPLAGITLPSVMTPRQFQQTVSPV